MAHKIDTKRNQAIRLAKRKGYYCDEYGNMYSKRGNKLKLRMMNKTYWYFKVRTDKLFGKREMTIICVHRFVAYCKYGEVIFVKGVQVRHRNGISTDNSYDNLLIGTNSDNQQDIPRIDRVKRGQYASSFLRKFTDEQEQSIIEFYRGCKSYKLTMEKFDVKKGTLQYIKQKYATRGHQAEVDEALVS
jgi:hypothetical protein